jgi:hypothetical protein
LCFGAALAMDLDSVLSTKHNPDVGATHSEGAVGVQALSHQEHDVSHAHADEECVALFRFQPCLKGEAFPIVALGRSPPH